MLDLIDKYQNLVPLGNIPSRVTLTYPYTPLVEVKQAQNAWSFRQISELESLKAHVLAWGVRQQQSLQAM